MERRNKMTTTRCCSCVISCCKFSRSVGRSMMIEAAAMQGDDEEAQGAVSHSLTVQSRSARASDMDQSDNAD